MNDQLVKIFSNIALYLAMDDVSFKARAYERVATAFDTLNEDVTEIYKREGKKGLEKISGVGKGIADKIVEYITTGKIKEYEDLRKKIPVQLDELISIEGVGPKMVRDLYVRLHVRNLADLERAAKAGKIRSLPHFGEKTEENILEGIEFVKKSQGRRLLGTIYPIVEDLTKKLRASPFIQKAVVAGSIRRMKETIGDVDILITTDEPKKAIEYFLSLVPHEKIWGKGSTKVSVRTTQGFDVDVRILPEEVFGAGLQYFTGSKEHNVKLRSLAISKGLKLSEYGLFRGKKIVACRTEQEVYKALGMPYIEPELREDAGEIEAALRSELPKLISADALKGDLQIQTNWTDGENSIEEMAKEAKKQGLEYIVITDHTKDLAMTGGADEQKLQKQMAEIDRVQKRVSGITILKGAEVNIRKDGTLDIADDVLSKLDVVGIAVHSNFKMSKKDMTERITRAMKNPHADILFHPTGRLIHKRDAYELDMEMVMKTAKGTGTILEIDAFPDRLDLQDSNIRKAVGVGVRLSIDSDAHHVKHIQYLKYGVAQARRGWAEKKDIINAWPIERMLSFLKDRRIKNNP